MKFLANKFFCRLLVALHGWLHFLAGEIIPHIGHDEQLSRLREFGWSLLERGDTLQRHIGPDLTPATLSAWRKLS
jgi:hypothetical protein